jgi:2-dehydro-3-deoxygluconokinase
MAGEPAAKRARPSVSSKARELYDVDMLEAGGELDFVSLGALVHRLDSGIVPVRKTTEFKVHVSGAEFNTSANLADCFQLRTGICSAMVKYPIGDLIHERVRAMGVRPFYKYFDHDGVTGPNMATVFSDLGQGVRAPVVFYNRSNEAAQRLKPGDFDWNAILGGTGARWFHCGGLFPALAASLPELVEEAMRKAKELGLVTSYDLNYRAKLWALQGGLERCQEVNNRICKYVDVLVGNEEDMQLGLGFQGQDVEKKSSLDTAPFVAMIDEVRKRHPNIKVVATTLREAKSTNRHNWSAVCWMNGKAHVAPTCELDVHDRVGGGDGFASGLIYGMLSHKSPEECLRLGWAHGALLTTYPGDTTMATLSQVEAMSKGASARIQR